MPGWHGVHVDWPLDEYDPSAHAVQMVADDNDDEVPAGHGLHESAPVAEEYLPCMFGTRVSVRV